MLDLQTLVQKCYLQLVVLVSETLDSLMESDFLVGFDCLF